MPSELQAALEALWERDAAGRSAAAAAPAAFAGVVATGTGFWGTERAAIREVARLSGLPYSGDLVRGGTTHLVVAGSGVAPAATQAGSKMQKAAEWGIPCVTLAWLLDSVKAGHPQPVDPYLLGREGAGACRLGGSCRQLAGRHRSSVASNARQAGAGGSRLQAEQHVTGCAVQNDQPQWRQQHERQQAGHSRAALSARPALAPVANMLADQLRRMSISPEPPVLLQPEQQDAQEGPALPASAQAGEAARASAAPLWPADSPPQHRSPSASPQHSLSLRCLPAGGTPDGLAAAAGSPVEVASRADAAAGEWARLQDTQSPGGSACPMQQDGSQHPITYSPMQQSPAGGALAQLQQPAGAMQQPGQPLPTSQGGPESGVLSLAAALQHTLSDEMAIGSPMADSPAAVPAGAGLRQAGRCRSGAPAGASPAPGSLAGTPGAANDSQEPISILPTPACIRDWSDDDSSAGSLGAAPAIHGGSPADGVTQTPPALRQALTAAANPTQFMAQQQQQQSKEQLALSQSWPQQQPLLSPLAQHGVAEAVPRTPAAVRDWSDDETVASAPAVAGECVISDSEPEDDQVLRAQQARQGQVQEAQAPQQGSPASAALSQPTQKQWQQPAAAAQPRKQLLQVSRSSAAGQPSAGGSKPASKLQLSRPQQASAAGASPLEHAVPPSPAGEAETDEPMAASLGGGWEPAQPSSMGGRDASPARQSTQAALQQQQLSPPASTSPAGLPAGEHHITSRRQGGSSRAQAHQQARRTVRDWSEDESSSGEEFPTPNGPRRKAAGGLTGLTQLDPASIVIARPKPSASEANCRAGEGGSQSSGGVLGLKFLQRPPRGNAVREHHGLPNLKAVQFAEQVQVSTAGGLVLSTKDKKTAVRLRPGGLTEGEAEDEEFRADSGQRRSSTSSRGGGQGGPAAAAAAAPAAGQQGEGEPTLAEPQTFYRLPDGSWWLEYCRYYTAEQAEAAAGQAGATVALPQGFDRSCELLKAVAREHAPMSDVAGGLQIRRVKQGGSMLRLRSGTAGGGSRSYFWRMALDTASWRVVTDRAAADFVAIE